LQRLHAAALDPFHENLQSPCGVDILPGMAKQNFLPNREDDLIAWYKAAGARSRRDQRK
jgi:hypothetical protein